jgi:YggT family protein
LYRIDPISLLLITLLGYYSYVVIAAVVMSWLVGFNVVNLHNRFVRSVAYFLSLLTEPVFRLVRKVLPPIAGLDLSPLVVLFAIWFVSDGVIPWVDSFFIPR